MSTQVEIPSKSVRFCIMDNEVEVGHAWLYFIKNDLHSTPYGLLEDVWVDEAYRGRGIATTLISDVIQRARTENCYKIIATSRNEREAVHSLYRHLGFVLHGYEFRIDLH